MHTTKIKITKNNTIKIMMPDTDIGHDTIHRIGNDIHLSCMRLI